MKKIILIAILFVVGAPVFAQQTFYEGFYTADPAIVRSIGRAIVNMLPEEKADWVDAVKHEERLSNYNGPLGASMHGFPARHFEQESLSNPTYVYSQRTLVLTTSIRSNHTLSGYKFKTPRPNDLLEITPEQVRFLQQFLMQPVAKKSFDATYTPIVSHPNGAETQLTFVKEGQKLILLINSRPEEQTVYFFLNRIPQKS